jgi:hypothetical protein
MNGTEDLDDFLARHGPGRARTARERQVAAVVAAFLAGEADRALLLAHDHLADHPDSPVVLRVKALLEDPCPS